MASINAPAPTAAPRDALSGGRAARVVRRQHADPAFRPFVVIWEATRACALACVHCRAEAQPLRHPGELTTAEARRLIGEIRELGSPPPLFVITGGDPFLRDDLLELVSSAADAGLPVGVSPSGTPSLTPAALAALHSAGATAVSLSIDGTTAEIHDRFRGVAGTFDQTLRAWDAAREVGLRVQIHTTVGRHNLTDLADVAHLVARHGAMTWSLFLLVPTGRGRRLAGLDAATVEDVLNFGYDAGAYVPTRTTEGHHFRRVVVQRAYLDRLGIEPTALLGLGPLYRVLRDRLVAVMGDQPRRIRRPPLDVSAGRGFVFISHLGDVYPSGFLPVSAGNVRSAPLGVIYRDTELFRGMRDPAKLHGRCGRCEFAGICGGSRARAFAVTGDLYAEEPWCAYQPGSFPFARAALAHALSAATADAAGYGPGAAQPGPAGRDDA